MDGNLRVKRILSFLSGLALVLLGPIGRMPAWAQLLTLGIGGVVASAILTPPSLTPQLSAALIPISPNGYSNNGLKVNGGGAAGATEFPTTQANSVFYTFEGSVDAMSSAPGIPSRPRFHSGRRLTARRRHSYMQTGHVLGLPLVGGLDRGFPRQHPDEPGRGRLWL